MTLFHEWGVAAGAARGRKQAHEFRPPDGDCLWAAGIWEEHPDFGPCYTMVTTAASPLISPIHDRMPALLGRDGMRGFLPGSGPWDFRPFPGALVVTPCDSPLAKPRDEGSQQELF